MPILKISRMLNTSSICLHQTHAEAIESTPAMLTQHRELVKFDELLGSSNARWGLVHRIDDPAAHHGAARGDVGENAAILFLITSAYPLRSQK